MEGGTRRAFDMPEALAFIGALAMLVSVFLVWMKAGLLGAVQGIEELSIGLPLFVLAAICFGAFAARTKGLLPGLAFVGLGLCGLALFGYFAYDFFAELSGDLGDLREGFYLAGVGSLLVLLGGISKMLTRGS